MKKQEQKRGWKFAVKLIIIFFLLSFAVSFLVSLFIEYKPASGNIALIPVKGVITIDGSYSFGTQSTSSTELIKLIKKADENPSIKAILFDINSGGGSAVASKQIADAVKRTNKSTFALIREIGASGAYWIAASTDYIIADELSITGSIGVISSYIELAGLLERYNMSYQRLVAGKYKDIGSPFKKLPKDEKDILQIKLNKIHDFFIREIAANRNMSIEKTREIATGEFYLGIEALDIGLVDDLGDEEKAREIIKQKLNLTEVKFVEYKKEKKLIDILARVFSENSFFIGRGIGSALTEDKTINRLKINT